MTAQTEYCANCYRPADECECEQPTVIFTPAFNEETTAEDSDCLKEKGGNMLTKFKIALHRLEGCSQSRNNCLHCQKERECQSLFDEFCGKSDWWEKHLPLDEFLDKFDKLQRAS